MGRRLASGSNVTRYYGHSSDILMFFLRVKSWLMRISLLSFLLPNLAPDICPVLIPNFHFDPSPVLVIDHFPITEFRCHTLFLVDACSIVNTFFRSSSIFCPHSTFLKAIPFAASTSLASLSRRRSSTASARRRAFEAFWISAFLSAFSISDKCLSDSRAARLCSGITVLLIVRLCSLTSFSAISISFLS
jgi:hypothetical protein